MSDKVSALEKRRLANIARNASVLEALAVPALPAAERAPGGGARKRRVKDAPAEEGLVTARRSSRLANPRVAGGIADELAFYRALEGRSTAERPERAVQRPVRAKTAAVGGAFAPDIELGRVPPAEGGAAMPGGWAALFEDAAVVKGEDGAYVCGRRAADVPLVLPGPRAVRKVAQDRVYCAALHPSAERVLAAVGTKYGYLVFWDATSVVDEYGSGDAHSQTVHSEMIEKAENGQSFEKAVNGESFETTVNGESFKETVHGETAGKVVHVAMHSESLFAVRYSRGGERAYTAGYDNVVRTVDTGGAAHAYGAAAYVHGADRGKWVCALDVRPDDTLVLADTDGNFACVDVRAGRRPVLGARLHERKAGGLAACPHRAELVASSSLDGTVCVWDVRRLGGAAPTPLLREQYGRAVTAVAWDPHCAAGRIVSTCWDDTLRIHSDVHVPGRSAEATLAIAHNNQTGRWITPFRPVWDPKTPPAGALSRFFVGNMARALDAISADGSVSTYSAPELLTSQPAANAVHATRDLVLSGTASGRALLWLPA